MKTSEVTQEEGSVFLGVLVKYAVNEQGQFEPIPSRGWQASNTAAEVIFGYVGQRIQEARSRVEQGLASPLTYHLEIKQMDDKLAAQYTGFFRWQIRRHQRPEVFRRLSRATLERYAQAFNLTVEQLTSLPAVDPKY